MSSEFEKKFVKVMSNAFYEINERTGYELFEPTKIEEISKKLVKLTPLVEELLLKPKRGVTLKDVEKEQIDFEKSTKAGNIGNSTWVYL
jgi:hypothetical protein